MYDNSRVLEPIDIAADKMLVFDIDDQFDS